MGSQSFRTCILGTTIHNTAWGCGWWGSDIVRYSQFGRPKFQPFERWFVAGLRNTISFEIFNKSIAKSNGCIIDWSTHLARFLGTKPDLEIETLPFGAHVSLICNQEMNVNLTCEIVSSWSCETLSVRYFSERFIIQASGVRIQGSFEYWNCVHCYCRWPLRKYSIHTDDHTALAALKQVSVSKSWTNT